MAFRTETRVGLALLLAAVAHGASYAVRHDHVRNGSAGALVITDAGISFQEAGKHADHSRQWRWTDIQQLTLSSDELRILTYEDAKWKLGRDREYVFEELPDGLATASVPVLRAHLQGRFVEALAQKFTSTWQAEAKLQRKFSGADGVIIAAADQIVFQAKRPDESRTWRIADIDSITSSGPYDLTITTYERARLSRADRSEFHFQLKERLPQDRYNALWRRVNEAKGWKDLNTLLPIEGEHHEP